MCQIAAEQWRPVPGWPAYEVSSRGRVRSTNRDVVYSNGQTRRYPGQILSPISDPDGYHQVVLCSAGSRRTTRIHRLVLAAFVGQCPEGMEALHTDDKKSHNCLTNLRYGSRSENQQDAVKNGLHVNTKKECCVNSHPLVVWNLVPSQASIRACLSCNRARSWIKEAKKRGVDLSGQYKSIADKYYEAILAEQAVAA